ncbi:MAG TPA: hypothetical protein VD994_15525 [Prosthecobacter sp.]|nr:hypothetical protein [Prosthecobacter sp.]
MNTQKLEMIESLEPRLAPAGTVLLSTAGGVLTITGDIANNDIRVFESAAGVWTVMDSTGAADTVFSLNGGTALASVSFDAPQSVRATLHGGNDTLFLDGLQINGTVSIYANDGDDNITIGTTINGAVSVDGGNGNDDFLGSGTMNSTVTVKMGAGSDDVTFNPGFYGRGLTVDLGAESNTFSINAAGSFDIFGPVSVSAAGGIAASQTYTLGSPDLFISGNVSFRTTAGTSTVALGFNPADILQINGSLGIQTAEGSDAIALVGDILVTGAFNIAMGNGGNTLSTTSLDELRAGSLSISGGTGNDAVTLEGSSVRINSHAVFNLAAGNNSLSLDQSSALSIGGSLVYGGGLNNDTITLAGPSVSIAGQLSITAGSGVNSFSSTALGSLTLGSIAFNGGAGSDSFMLDGTTVTVGGHATLTMGAGANSTTFSPSTSLRIGGSIAFTGTTGNDTLTVEGPVVNIGGQVNSKGGDGLNTVLLNQVNGAIGSISLTGGTGQDLFNIGNFGGATTLITVHGNIVTSVGAGIGDVSIRNTLVYGGVTHTSAALSGSTDTLFIRESDIIRATTVNMTGAAAANVAFDDSTFRGAVTVSTGGDNDQVAFDANLLFTGSESTFRGAVKIYLGAGSDIFKAGIFPPVANVANNFLSSLLIDGGADNDTANFQTGYGNSFSVPATVVSVEVVT